MTSETHLEQDPTSAAVREAQEIMAEHAAAAGWCALVAWGRWIYRAEPILAQCFESRIAIDERASERLTGRVNHRWLVAHFGRLYLDQLQRASGGDQHDSR